MRIRSKTRQFAVVVISVLALVACGSDADVADDAPPGDDGTAAEDPGDTEGDDGDTGDTGETGGNQADVLAAIDEIAAQVEAGELAYDPGSDADEAIEALREAIPQPEGYPGRPIEILIGFGEGGGSDNYTRNVGRDAERILGQRLIYNNMPGASGEVALGHMFTQAADGYTIASAITNQVINDALDIQPYSFVDDVAFIIRQQGPTEIYWVAADNEWETFEDMLDYAAENPGQVRVSGSGIGSDDEFRLLALGSEIDSTFGFVPFDGVGGRISALLAGDIDVLHETAGTVMDLYEDGQIRPLAYGGDIVFEDIDPDIPSVADLGYPVPTGRWRGMVAPGDVDQEIIDYLHNVFYASAQLPSYKEYEVEFLQHVAGGYLNGEEFEAEARRERDEIAALAEEFGYDAGALQE
ncbi:tripartite tricarboxylate transporter substrate binding protein [Egicoccus sp. AB-alg6-2]|uniref:tripartite tricarboxylate transporter substrate binding protein n=1 Tax=Egicoccus sp. AB-alg6-2 TaxID=3242692 RepID=UPI00359E1926